MAISSASASETPSATLRVSASAAKTGSQQPREQRLGKVPGDQRGYRDADLGAGQLERQRAVGALDELVAPAAGAGVGVDGAALEGGQGELGRDENRRARGQDHEGQQASRV